MQVRRKFKAGGSTENDVEHTCGAKEAIQRRMRRNLAYMPLMSETKFSARCLSASLAASLRKTKQ
jgi:hypothetical protein